MFNSLFSIGGTTCTISYNWYAIIPLFIVTGLIIAGIKAQRKKGTLDPSQSYNNHSKKIAILIWIIYFILFGILKYTYWFGPGPSSAEILWRILHFRLEYCENIFS